MPKLRITNITSLKHPPVGFGLDFNGHYIGANPTRPLIIDIPVMPFLLEEWEAKGWVKIQDADDKTPVSMPVPSEKAVTPGTQLNEVSDSLMEEEELDLTVAKEAALVGAEKDSHVPLQDINQAPKAKVSLGSEDENMSSGLSPIPGDRPVSVDDSEKFTVKAPRSQGPGAVVRTS
jgi:hypothetical protein